MNAQRHRVLIVDDDASHREMLRALLADLGVEADCAADGQDALGRMADAVFDLVLLDMRMPVLGGLATLEQMAKRDLRPVTIVLTAHADLDDAVRAMKLGAVDYLRKPIDVDSLRSLLDSHLGIGGENSDELPPLPDGVVIRSPLMREVCQDLVRVAGSDAPVLLRGETGTGKDVLAGLVHHWSERRDGPLVAVNVAALPDGLVESELFGVRKGAYTGADVSREGLFESANTGTLFLDEIGDLPLGLQPKLLRVLQTRCVTRIGDSAERAVDFRLLSATNRDLESAVQEESFRQDLYYRIAVIVVEVPPLRERPEDILPLAARFLARVGPHKRLSLAAQQALLAYSWPGNVRELENTMLRAGILAAGEVVMPDNLPPNLRATGSPSPAPDGLALADVEKRAILEALERADGNRSEAARLLGISRRKLLYRLKEYREAEQRPD
jgi:DNA-binding NtrC family response regulator